MFDSPHTRGSVLGVMAVVVWVGSPGLPVPDQQAAQGTDIWIAELMAEDGRIEIGAVTRVTNRPGYDNQPHLLPGRRRLLYTSVDSMGQADIWQADLSDGTAEPFSRTTPESEYSPTLMPDGRGISVVRVEADSTQRLWRFDLDGGSPELLIDDVAPVGYHAWADADRVALFVLGDPPTLRIVDVRSGQTRTAASNVGRSLHRIPDRGAISFVQFDSEGSGTIRAVDVETGVLATLTRARPGSQDYTWTPDGTLLMAEGSVLYQWSVVEGWRAVADLAPDGLQDVTRLTVSPEGDRIALVGTR
jgi:Tol biopolymer transport system component